MIQNPTLYIETYGCQMNVADSEVVASVMATVGYEMTEDLDKADAVLLNLMVTYDCVEERLGEIGIVNNPGDGV